MIFVTVGSADPFDRLIRAVDNWAAARREPICFPDSQGVYGARSSKARSSSHPTSFGRACWPLSSSEPVRNGLDHHRHGAGKADSDNAKVARLGEHRNDHQVATAERFGAKPGVLVAGDENRLVEILDGGPVATKPEKIEGTANSELIAAIRDFIVN